MAEEDLTEEPIFTIASSQDDRGFHLRIETDDDDYKFLVPDTRTARSVLAEVSKLRVWIDRSERGTPTTTEEGT